MFNCLVQRDTNSIACACLRFVPQKVHTKTFQEMPPVGPTTCPSFVSAFYLDLLLKWNRRRRNGQNRWAMAFVFPTDCGRPVWAATEMGILVQDRKQKISWQKITNFLLLELSKYTVHSRAFLKRFLNYSYEYQLS